jgi:hypothetical protein
MARLAYYSADSKGNAMPSSLVADMGEIAIPTSTAHFQSAIIQINPAWHVMSNGGIYWLAIMIKQPSPAIFPIALQNLDGGTFIPNINLQSITDGGNYAAGVDTYCASQPYGAFPKSAPANLTPLRIAGTLLLFITH